MSSDSPRPRWFEHRDLAGRHAYATRFTEMEAQGKDVDGEARFVDALAERRSVILDAGCGTGRVAAALARAGHRAHGIDVDPVLVEAGRAQHPELPLVVLDLARATPDALVARGFPPAYDVIVSAGNVMHFVADGTEEAIVANLAALLAPRGRLVVGFATGRAFTHDRLDEHAAGSRLVREHRFADWELRPFHRGSDWAVSVYSRALL